MAAIWTFQNVREDQFPAGLSIETNIEIFRSNKGDIEKTVPGSLSLRNPTTGLLVEVHVQSLEGVRAPGRFDSPDDPDGFHPADRGPEEKRRKGSSRRPSGPKNSSTC